MPDDIEEKTVAAADGSIGLPQLLKEAGLCASVSDAMRMIKQGAVKIDGERMDDKGHSAAVGSEHIYQVGKRRFAKVSVS